MKLDILTALNSERAARRAAIVVSNIATGEQRLVKATEITKDPLRTILGERLRSGKSGMVDSAERARLPHRPRSCGTAGRDRRRAYQPGIGPDC